MKKLLLIISAAGVITACNNNPKTGLDTNKQIVSDTGRMYNNNLYTDTGTVATAVAPGGAIKSTRQITYKDNTGTHTSTTTTTTTNTNTVPSPTPSNRVAPHHSARSHRTSRGYSNSGNTASTGGGTGTTQPVRRRGWSKAAKGAVIGGVGGAVAGAIIDKKHGQGAVIGGVVGAAGGYIIGRGKDKRDGR